MILLAFHFAFAWYCLVLCCFNHVGLLVPLLQDATFPAQTSMRLLRSLLSLILVCMRSTWYLFKSILASSLFIRMMTHRVWKDTDKASDTHTAGRWLTSFVSSHHLISLIYSMIALLASRSQESVTDHLLKNRIYMSRTQNGCLQKGHFQGNTFPLLISLFIIARSEHQAPFQMSLSISRMFWIYKMGKVRYLYVLSHLPYVTPLYLSNRYPPCLISHPYHQILDLSSKPLIYII